MSKNRQERRRDRRRAEAQEARQFENILPAMPPEQRAALDAVAQAIDRKVGVDESRQPRFTDAGNLFFSTVRWATGCMTHEPGANASMREWDAWYLDFASQEPFLSGCLASAVQIDKNRGWTLTGGRNQVAQYKKRLHAFKADLTGIGWRPHIEWLAQSFYATRMGFVCEVGSQGKGGPLTDMWTVDPCRCELTGNVDKPLAYYPRMGGRKDWQYGIDFIRGCSQKSIREEKLGYGFPAIARCYSLAKIMVGVYRHYEMKTGITTPDGILAHNAMSDDQWRKALEVREQELLRNPDDYLNKIISVGNPGGEVPQFVLTILSSLPDRFDIEQWTLILMRGYQLAFGYGAGEFYPEQYSVIGRGKEQEQQHRSSTGKGGKDFCLTHAEQLQSRLPETLEFGYEERDITGEIEDADLQLKKAQVITEMSGWVSESGGDKQSRLTTDQIMQLAAQAGVVPEEWTPQEETSTATDEDAPDTERIQRAMHTFPDEPIVRYSSTTNKMRILHNPHRKLFFIQRLGTSDVRDEYEAELSALVTALWAGEIGATTLAARHRELIREYGPRMYAAAGGGDQAMLDEWIAEQLSYVDDFAAAAAQAREEKDKQPSIVERIAAWAATLSALGLLVRVAATGDTPLTMVGIDGQETCRTCQDNKGQKRPATWWIRNRMVPHPGNNNYICGCWKCKHYLQDDLGRRFRL